jgi:hypothetical protein
MSVHALPEVHALRDVIKAREHTDSLVPVWLEMKCKLNLPDVHEERSYLQAHVWRVVTPYARAIVSEICVDIVNAADEHARSMVPSYCPLPPIGPMTPHEHWCREWLAAAHRESERKTKESWEKFHKDVAKKRKAEVIK